jgi:hypothetical protein
MPSKGAICYFATPIGLPYKYLVGGIVKDDQLMAIYSLIYCASILSSQSNPCDEILTYGYVKPWVQWFPTKEDPPIDPFSIVRGL